MYRLSLDLPKIYLVAIVLQTQSVVCLVERSNKAPVRLYYAGITSLLDNEASSQVALMTLTLSSDYLLTTK